MPGSEKEATGLIAPWLFFACLSEAMYDEQDDAEKGF
jgi:hypothetical protein